MEAAEVNPVHSGKRHALVWNAADHSNAQARRNKAGRRDPAAPAGISGAAGVAHVGGARSIN